MNALSIAQDFFTDYARMLLARDADGIAGVYAVPSLIVGPDGSAIVVTDEEQTRQFFAQAFPQYDGISEAERAITIPVSSDVSIWADVTWSYDGQPRERFVYQLVRRDERWRIAVLTPIPLATS